MRSSASVDRPSGLQAARPAKGMSSSGKARASTPKR